MKLFKAFLSALICCNFVTYSALAQEYSTQPLVITPDNLQSLLVQNNTSIQLGLNKLYDAKIQVNAARAKLLPSLNLGYGTLAGGSDFLQTTVSALLPFLIPSNWFELKNSQYMLDAEGTSYYILKLNQFASAYSLYHTTLSDISIRQLLYQQYFNLLSVQTIAQNAYENGVGRLVDVQETQAQVQLALIQLSQMDDLIHQEKASIRQILALPLETEIQLQQTTVPENSFETTKIETLVEAITAVSPEKDQLNSLAKATEQSTWSRVFAFLTGASLNSQASNSGGVPQSASFSRFAANFSLNLGFGYFPALQLNNNAKEALKIRQKELLLEQTYLAETILYSIDQAKQQAAAAADAEYNYMKIFNAQVQNYSMGLIDLAHVLDAQNNYTRSIASRLRSEMALANQRINLHRLMIHDQFSNITSCRIRFSRPGFFQRIKEIFSSSAPTKSIDDICR